jgi:hypothetical protein
MPSSAFNHCDFKVLACSNTRMSKQQKNEAHAVPDDIATALDN